jgi:hypothetical protein
VITNSISPGFCECANTSPGTVEALQCTAPPGGACCRETSGVLTLTARCYCAQSCSDGDTPVQSCTAASVVTNVNVCLPSQKLVTACQPFSP